MERTTSDGVFALAIGQDRFDAEIVKRLNTLEVGGKPPSEGLALVKNKLSAEEKGVVQEALQSLRAVLENLASSVIWRGLMGPGQ